MKKVPLVLVFLLVAILLASCMPPLPPLPTKNEVLPFCKDQYEQQLVRYPDYPHAFVGACVSYFQSGKYNAMVPLCKYESFRESIEKNTIEECEQYIRSQ